MKFLILLFYYERPEFLKNALESVKNSTYKNWDLCVIDDGTDKPGLSVIDDCFSYDERLSHKITYIQTFDSKESKLQRGGSQFGEYANCVIKISDADVVLMLCDDDLLMPEYMCQLDRFYRTNDHIKYSYSHLIFYDPTVGPPSQRNVVDTEYTRYLNSNTDPINPARMVDSSQVSWKRDKWMSDGLYFPSPRTSNLDEVIFEQMYEKWGGCPFNEIVGQWKGIHEGQLINF